MKRRNKVYFLMIFWIAIIAFLYSQGFITTDVQHFYKIISNHPMRVRILFIFLSTIRVVLFIPQTVFILIGSRLFGPYEGFFLSIISLILSQSVMYVIGRYFQRQLLGTSFLEKNKSLIEVIKKYGYKLLALGIVCPVTPSDLIILLAACIKLDYRKSIVTTAIADAPMIFLYGFIGSSIEEVLFFKIFAILVILFISYYTFTIWKKINKAENQYSIKNTNY